jgi:hypothetical protein
VEEIAYPQPSHLKSWTDGDGTLWRRIGNEPLDKKEAQRLVHDPTVRVVAFDDVEPSDMSSCDREFLWDRLKPGMARKPSDNPFADLLFFKYRDDARAVLLAIEVRC